MPVKATVQNIEEIEEPLRPLYVERDGRYILDVESADGYQLENVEGLKNTVSTLRRERNELAAQLKEAKAQPVTVSDTGGLEARERQIIETAAQEKAALETKLQKLEAKYREVHVTGALQAELAKARPIDGAAEMLATVLAKSVRVVETEQGEFGVEIVDADGNPRIKFEGGAVRNMTIEDLVKEARDQRPTLFRADETMGLDLEADRGVAMRQAHAMAGAPNPFDGRTLNITEQMKLIKKNPAMARQMARAAGVNLPGIG